MEKWQKEYLTTNLAKLVEETVCNEVLFAHLLSEGVLAKVDVERIKQSNGRYGQAAVLYDLVETRSNGFVGMARALFKVEQSGPLKVFMDGFEQHVIPDIKVDFLERTILLSEVFDASELEKIANKLKSYLTLEKYVNLYTRSQNTETIKLLRNTIPGEVPFYVSRSMSRRVKINSELFNVDCPDVFVFKEIDSIKLKKLVEPSLVESSSTQLLSLSSRFIILEHADDWEEICKTANVPVHLIKCEEDNKQVLEATTGNSTVIDEYLEYRETSEGEAERVSVSEEDFFEEVSRDGASGVCICDLPGMGKSLLLANFARRMNCQHPDRLVLFIQLAQFLRFVVARKKTISLDAILAKKLLIEYVTPSHLEYFLLTELLHKEAVALELFLDAFDEIQEIHVKNAKQLLPLLAKLPNTRIFVTSRPNMRQELESSLCVISYDILPFTHANQVNFLTAFWRKLKPTSSELKLNEFAVFCIRQLQKSLDANVDSITGIPLQCRLVAEVFSRPAILFAHPQRNVLAKALCQTEGTLNDLYKKYFELRFDKIHSAAAIAENSREMFMWSAETATVMVEAVVGKNGCHSEKQEIKVFHMLQAMKLLFPEYTYIFEKLYGQLASQVPLSKVLSVGILQLQFSGGEESLHFMHRTFAEYLAAECFTSFLYDDETCDKELAEKLFCILYREGTTFDMQWFSVILYFMNSACEGKKITSKNQLIFKTFSSSVDCNRLCYILQNTVNKNYVNIFLLVKELVLQLNPDCFRPYKNMIYSKKDYPSEEEFRLLNLLYIAVQSQNILFLEQLFALLNERFHFPINLLRQEILKYFCLFSGISDSKLDFEVKHFPEDMIETYLLVTCIQNSRFMAPKDFENLLGKLNWFLDKIENIALKSSYDLLCTGKVPVDIIKLLLRKGLNSRTSIGGSTLVHAAAKYMTDKDFAQLFRILSQDFKAIDLFEEIEGRWRSPLPQILCNELISERTIQMIYQLPWLDGYDIGATAAGRISVDINYRDKSGRTLFMCAAVGRRSIENLKMMMEMGADVTLLQDNTGNTFAHCLGECEYSPEDYHEIVQLLIENKMGKTFQTVDENGETPLHVAVKNLELLPKTLDLLVGRLHLLDGQESIHNNENCYVDLNAVNELGNSILCEALIGRRSLTLVKCLVENGAVWSIKNKRNRGLAHLSALHGLLDHLKYFLELGCDINEVDEDGNNPLQCAVKKHYPNAILNVKWHTLPSIVKFLVDNGAQKKNKNKEGKTAYMLALQHFVMDARILKLLKDT